MARSKRKARPAARPEAAAAAPPSGREAMRRGYARGAECDAAIRATLTPLAPGEHPPALKAAIVVALGLALANLVAFATGSNVAGAGGLVFVAVMLLAAWGMWRQRYWAVLGFATLLALIAVAFTLLLLIASNVLAVVLCLAFAGSAGFLFWKLIRVMARLQAPQRVS